MHAKLHLIRMVDTLMTAHTLPAQRCFSRATPENTVMLNLVHLQTLVSVNGFVSVLNMP